MIGGSLLALIGIEVFSGIRQLISFFSAVCDYFISPILEDRFVWIENLFQSTDLAALEFLESDTQFSLEAHSTKTKATAERGEGLPERYAVERYCFIRRNFPDYLFGTLVAFPARPVVCGKTENCSARPHFAQKL